METPEISVIIPVFNAEKYIAQCLRSVQEQDVEDLEVICVDDGSTDGSAAMVEELAARDPRIRLIRQENRSAGAARNHGMRYARGKYLHFMDADDALYPGIYRRAADRLEQTGGGLRVPIPDME